MRFPDCTDRFCRDDQSIAVCVSVQTLVKGAVSEHRSRLMRKCARTLYSMIGAIWIISLHPRATLKEMRVSNEVTFQDPSRSSPNTDRSVARYPK